MAFSEHLYIHIPFCLSKCSYCDFFSIPCKASLNSYIYSLCNELKIKLRENNFSLKTVYVGGGTPSLLLPYQIEQVFSEIKPYLMRDSEITFEMNPEDASELLLKSLCSCGVNRISCGIQSMNQKALEFTGRRANAVGNKRALELFKAYWHGFLSLDFISGLPFETEDSLIEGLKLAVDMKPEHISLYSLVLEEETPLGKLVKSGRLDFDFDFSDKLWFLGRDFLEANGYFQYEISNFSKKGMESIHNSAYWSRKSYLGCGSGAVQTFYNPSQKTVGTALRFTNTTDIAKYTAFWKDECELDYRKIPGNLEEVSYEASVFEFFMMGLRKLKGITKNEFLNSFEKDIPLKIIELFKKWQKKGIAQIIKEDDDIRYSLTHDGILFLNAFLEQI